MAKPKIAVAVSGGGRSLKNFLSGDFAFEVGAVITSSPKAGAVAIAEQANQPIYFYDFKSPEILPLDAWLLANEIKWVALAGFLKPFPMLPSFANRVINIHPSLLPKYGGHGMYGMKVHDAVFTAKETHSGASIHFVNDRYDEGSLIAQAKVELQGILSPSDLAEQVFCLECEFYPAVLNRLIAVQLPLNDGQVWTYEKEK